jgi:Flp pilus assembly pilin Flp
MRFLKEEKAQGAIEYILLAGGIIVAAVVIFAIYSSMVSSAGTSLNESVGLKVGQMGNAIAAQPIS